MKTLESFKSGAVKIMVATDVAGRGIHVDGVSHVINYTLPEEPEDYVHRIGRTGRAGKTGTSISFACEDDAFLLEPIEKLLDMKLACTMPEEKLLQEIVAKPKPKASPKPASARVKSKPKNMDSGEQKVAEKTSSQDKSVDEPAAEED